MGDILHVLQPELNPQKHRMLEDLITKEETKSIMKNLPYGKMAGIDGIPYELWVILNRKHDPQNPQTLDVKCLLTSCLWPISSKNVLSQAKC